MTASAERFKRLIRAHGPIPVAQYMAESNALYYASRDPLGAGGDFVTAPEISQMFGELIGLWCADLWHRAGAPPGMGWAELGPGRGTLAADALRAMAAQGFRPDVHLVESSPALRRAQARAVPAARFHENIDTLCDAPLFIVANEFFDALAVRQLIRTPAGWRERMVGLDGEELAFMAGNTPMDAAVPPLLQDSEPGTIIETSPATAAIWRDLADRVRQRGGALLAIDYGYLEPRPGSTLQAVRAHRKIGVFDAPGDMDLTAHVDFATLGDIAREAGCTVHAATQGEWLRALGLDVRAAQLSRQSPAAAEAVADARRRLTDADEMGALFKVMAIQGADWPSPAGFA
ncbi:class I SAM-dependent methyltransferase [Qipengyuania sp.]|uniref:class I SAM-dependent methyltransferase n=1 Tax=Qipengyuania sp. TaxID=2004515 RepID=UPI0037355851